MTTQTLDHAAASQAQADELAARLRAMPRVRYPEPVTLTARCKHGADDGCSACEALAGQHDGGTREDGVTWQHDGGEGHWS